MIMRFQLAWVIQQGMAMKQNTLRKRLETSVTLSTALVYTEYDICH